MADSDLQDQQVTSHKCDVCGKSYKSKYGLQRHISVHGTHDFKCHVCQKELSNKYSYKSHLNTHKEDKNICPACGKSFSRPYWLNRHEETVHGRPAKFKCPECGKACSCNVALQAHVADHMATGKQYCCSKCNHEFKYKSTKARHERKCNPENKKSFFVCAVCQKSFRLARLLKQHNRVHMPPRYTCHVCGRAFHWKACLTKHLKSCKAEKAKPSNS